MTGPEHYAEAQELVTVDWGSEIAPMALAAAQVHATLALAAATIEAADQDWSTPARPLIIPPTQGDDVDPAFPGSPWGRAFYGEAKS